MPQFGDYIVFVDESGDHSLQKVDPDFPIFVLLFTIIRKDTYAQTVVPAVKALKFRHWGHDSVILHSHEIRKPRGDFGFLQVEAAREAFMTDLNEVLAGLDATLVAVVIRKDRLAQRYRTPFNPYNIALGLGLERVCAFLLEKKQDDRLTHLIAESRGDKEDKDLEDEFRRVMNGEGSMGSTVGATPFDLRIVSKKANLEGLQLADLFAHPIGRHVLKPAQPNRAFDLVRPKIRAVRGGYQNVGLKVFP